MFEEKSAGRLLSAPTKYGQRPFVFQISTTTPYQLYSSSFSSYSTYILLLGYALICLPFVFPFSNADACICPRQNPHEHFRALASTQLRHVGISPPCAKLSLPSPFVPSPCNSKPWQAEVPSASTTILGDVVAVSPRSVLSQGQTHALLRQGIWVFRLFIFCVQLQSMDN